MVSSGPGIYKTTTIYMIYKYNFKKLEANYIINISLIIKIINNYNF